MANMKKFTKMQAMAVIAHQERTGSTHSNENIDPEQTKYNYSVWPYDDPDLVGEKHGWNRLTKRLSEVKYLNRKDVNVLVEWTIHLGPDVPPGYDNEEEFFRACMRYCEREYGAENICYGIVHVDEENPHLTVGFVPVVKKPLKLRKNASAATKAEYEAAVAAGKTMIEVVDADSVITRKHLQGWHSGLTNYLVDELGYDPAVYTGITKELGGNKTVKQLKRMPAKWREQRNKRVEQFHEVRRAAKNNQKAGLDAVIAGADPNRQRLQQDFPEQTGEKANLLDQIKDATNRGGRSSW